MGLDDVIPMLPSRHYTKHSQGQQKGDSYALGMAELGWQISLNAASKIQETVLCMKQFIVLTVMIFILVQSVWADIREDWQKCERVNKRAASAEAHYCIGLEAGRGGNEQQAVKYFRMAGDQNHPGAQAMLGFHYERGLGIKQDYAEAAKWYRKAAEQGHTEAMNNLGNLYRTGKGVPQNNEEAIKWYRLAAEHDNAPGR
jgi:tetratricopeptide (TPR) repeat protein